MSTLLLVSDLGYINDLADTLTRFTAFARSPLVVRSHRPDVLALGEAGTLRLRAIADGLPAPVMDVEYLRAGSALHEAAGHLAPSLQERAPGSARAKTSSCCAALAEVVLLASGHAADAALYSRPRGPEH